MYRSIGMGLAVALLVMACGTDEVAATTTSLATTTSTTAATTTSSTTATTSSTTTTTTTTLPPIEHPHVEVNGARLVYRCAGEGPISIVIDQYLYDVMNQNRPLWDNFMGWDRVVAGLEDSARVCIYNRQGVGGSDLIREGTALRTTEDQVSDLVGLVEALEMNPPVVFIGNSVAGFNLVVLADRHPELVAGIVFADASTAAQITFTGACCASAPEYLDLSASAQIVGEVESLGDIPIYVLTAEKMTQDQFGDDWLRVQTDLAAMSSVSRHDVVAGGSHALFGTSPDAIVEATLWVIEQAGL